MNLLIIYIKKSNQIYHHVVANHFHQLISNFIHFIEYFTFFEKFNYIIKKRQ